MKTCNTCKANKVCDHNRFGFENCGNYIPDNTDFVEVVRCKDCIYWENGKSYTPYCNNFGSMLEDTKAEDFCCFGEKRRDT